MDHIAHRLFVLAWLLGCEAPVETINNTVNLKLVESEDCRPRRAVDQLIVEALGNFPASDGRNVEVLPVDGSVALTGFPVGTRVLRVEATSSDWTGHGVQLLGEGDSDRALLLMPLGQSCPLADPELRSRGAMAVALPDGGALLFGGRDDEGASRRAVRLQPGAQSATRLTSDLSNRRVGGSAVLAGGVGVGAWGSRRRPRSRPRHLGKIRHRAR